MYVMSVIPKLTKQLMRYAAQNIICPPFLESSCA